MTINSLITKITCATIVFAFAITAVGQQPLPQQQRMAELPNPTMVHSNYISRTLPTSSRRAPEPNIVTKTINLKDAFIKYAATDELKLENARLEGILFLGLTPLAKTKRSATDRRPTFELVGVDKFEVTADESYFEALPAMVRSLELGKKRIAIHVRTFTVDPKQTTRINAFIKQGTARVNCAKLPTLIPIATTDDKHLGSSDISPASFVSTTTVVRENMPVTTGQITLQELAKLENYLKQSKSTNTLSAPSVFVFPGQVATISDASLRPFVVGLNTIKRDRASASQPVIQSVEDGTTIRVKAIPRGDKIQLLSDIAISKVIDVNTFTVAEIDQQRQTAIQIPKQSIRQVNLSTMLDQDRAFFVDPNFVQMVESKGPRGNLIKTERKIMFVLRAEIIDVEPHFGQRFGMSKPQHRKIDR